MSAKILLSQVSTAPQPAPADYRHTCGRLLFRGVLMVGTVIQVRCPKCGGMHVIDTRTCSVGLGAATLASPQP